MFPSSRPSFNHSRARVRSSMDRARCRHPALHASFIVAVVALCITAGTAFTFLEGDLPQLTDFAYRSRSGIPLILHLTWKTTSVPAQFQYYLASWIKNNPHWKLAYWTDISSRALVAEK